MSKKLKQYILDSFKSSTRLQKKYGEKIEEQANATYESYMADDDSEIDDEDLTFSFLDKKKDFIHNELHPTFLGKITNEKGRALAKKFNIDVKAVSDGENINYDKVIESLHERFNELNAKKSNTENESEEIKGLKKTILELEGNVAKFNEEKETEILTWKQKADQAEKDKTNFINKQKEAKLLNDLVRQAYEGATLREGLTFNDLAEDYPLQLAKKGIALKVDGDKLIAVKSDNPEELFLSGTERLNLNKDIRATMDRVYSPVAQSGKSFGEDDFKNDKSRKEESEDPLAMTFKEIKK